MSPKAKFGGKKAAPFKRKPDDKASKSHANGAKAMQSSTAVVVDEAIEVTGRIAIVAMGTPLGVRCDLVEDCMQLVTHQVPVRVDGRDGVVYGCDTHLPQWIVAMGSESADDGA